MRKIVLFVFLLGALCANAVDVTSYYKPAQYQEARYQEAQYEASYNAARYSEAVSDMSWSNSMLGRKITITNDKGITNRDFGTVGAPAPAFKTASGQTSHVYGGGGIGNAGGLAGGSKGQNNSTFSQQVNAAVVPMDIPQVKAEGDATTEIKVYCPKCGELIGSIKINKIWGQNNYRVNSQVNSVWGWILAGLELLFGYNLTYEEALSAADQLKERMIQEHLTRDCPNPAPLGSSLIPLLLMLLCYALFRLVRGDVREEQEMA